MRRFIFTITIISTLLGISSCRRVLEGSGNYIDESRDLTTFTKVRSEGEFDVVLEKDSVQSVVVTAEDNIMPEVETVVQNGKLIIRFSDEFKIYRSSGITVHIHSPEIDGLELTGSGNMISLDAFDTESADITLTGSGEIVYAANCTEIEAEITGSGDITLSGNGTQGKYKIEGSGNIHAFDLALVNADVIITGSGNCEVSASSTLDVTITGSGDVIYDGTPLVTTTITGSGEVRPR